MILPQHALNGNGDKPVKKFPSTLESATSWLDIHESLKCTRFAVAGTRLRSKVTHLLVLSVVKLSILGR